MNRFVGLGLIGLLAVIGWWLAGRSSMLREAGPPKVAKSEGRGAQSGARTTADLHLQLGVIRRSERSAEWAREFVAELNADQVHALLARERERELHALDATILALYDRLGYLEGAPAHDELLQHSWSESWAYSFVALEALDAILAGWVRKDGVAAWEHVQELLSDADVNPFEPLEEGRAERFFKEYAEHHPEEAWSSLLAVHAAPESEGKFVRYLLDGFFRGLPEGEDWRRWLRSTSGLRRSGALKDGRSHSLLAG